MRLSTKRTSLLIGRDDYKGVEERKLIARLAQAELKQDGQDKEEMRNAAMRKDE
jgi:hypothetical protein